MNPASNAQTVKRMRLLDDAIGNNVALMLARVDDEKLVQLCAIFVDQNRLSMSDADSIIKERLGTDAVALSRRVAEYRAPWWAPWRRGSARWAIR
jgi:hypothetical protein